MNKSLLGIVAFIATLFLSAFAFGQGFTGPGTESKVKQAQSVTVEQAKSFPEDTLVILKGNVVQSVSRDKYIFRDATGDITVDIDRDLWILLGLTLSANDRVEIGGKIDHEKRHGNEVDVKYIKKL
ncbi:MAG: NirD/YgiW/YdeI family stress tolerance protein [Burkholderiales bacterium]|jgi:uncharacterized protein (TIGR00156 family)|nr:NirD/YgiW/YdeI family stress tolerance protein [Burkholderiales bacterium]